MQINIIKSVEDAIQAKGLTVIIDVFRAFSVEAYLFHNGAKYIIPVQTLEEAYKLKKEHPDYILI
jgi:2-phosphosulfolactate phosphatase